MSERSSLARLACCSLQKSISAINITCKQFFGSALVSMDADPDPAFYDNADPDADFDPDSGF
jgi:hypothetical protein